MEIELPGSKHISHNLQKGEQQQNGEFLTVKSKKVKDAIFLRQNIF